VKNAEPADPKAVERLQQVWESHAKEDPLWAIISTPWKRGGKWDLEEFLKTGRDEIAALAATLETHGISFDAEAALDFGCGVGRLSQALAGHFGSVCGVDISPTMIETAQRLNSHGDRCQYFVNAHDHLQLFAAGQFTFIYSNVVLQHIHPSISRRYLVEFARLARPGALVVFQLPSRIIKEDGLPADAWSANLQWNNETRSCPPSIRGVLQVSVENTSSAVWHFDDQRPVMVGNHWLAEDGEMMRLDDGRAMLPNHLAPGERAEVEIEVSTPPAPGVYILELDLVQEGVSWFKSRGSETLRVPINVVAASPDVRSPAVAAASAQAEVAEPETAAAPAPEPAGAAEPAGAPAVFENFSMHVIPRAEVIDLLHGHGLRLEYIHETDRGGPGYQSYVYYLRKV
jgi:SAM-dependent methyltransferase